MAQELGQEKATSLMQYEGVVTLTRGQAIEILKTIWPRAPEVEVLKAAMICHQYGLNPLMKHIFLIPFKRREQGKVVGDDWVVVLGIGATRLIANRRHNYSYLDLTPRRMSAEEQEKILGEVDESKIWAITKLKDMRTGTEAMGIGFWPKDDVPYGAEKGNTKLNMACVRSERQALDRQFPGEMPQGVEVIDEQYQKPSISSLPEPPTVTTIGGDFGLVVAELQELKPEEAEEEGFRIDPAWLSEAAKRLKWSEPTMLSFIIGQYKVAGKTVTEALGKLTREQAQKFVKEIDSKVVKQTDLWG